MHDFDSHAGPKHSEAVSSRLPEWEAVAEWAGDHGGKGRRARLVFPPRHSGEISKKEPHVLSLPFP